MADLLRRDQELDALGVNGDVADLTDATDFIDRFVAIIDTPGTVTQPTLEYLTVDSFLPGPGADWPLGARHLLYWLDRLLKANKANGTLTYTNRLSDMAGWGEVAPDNLTDADPLGLYDLFTVRNINTIVIDNDAADDATADSQFGCVVPTYRGGSTHPCKTIGGVTKDPNNLFVDGNETEIWYPFWNHLDGLAELGGSTSVRFPKTTVESVVLVRWSTDHQVAREITLRKVTTDSDNARITIMGYPGEFPEIRMGNSTSAGDTTDGNDGDVTPTSDQVGIAQGGAARPAMITIGNGADTGRANVHFRNMDFVGNRDRVGAAGLVFASRIFTWSSTSSGSIRYCRFRETQFIRPDDSAAATYPGLVDTVWAARPTDLDPSAGVRVDADNFVFDSNYVEPVAAASWRLKPENYATFASVWLEIKADNVRMTRNTFRGVKTNSMMRAGDADTTTDGFYCADNDMESYDKACIDLFNSTNFVVERNRCRRFGQDTYNQESGTGIKVSYSTDGIVRHNVVHNQETAEVGTLGIVLQNISGEQNTERIDIYENIVYRCGVRLDRNSAGTITDNDVRRNIIAGMNEARKGTTHTNAPIHLELTLSDGTTEGNRITDNIVWRFTNADPTSNTIETGPHLSIRITGSQNQYLASEETTGWTDNTAQKPAWASTPESGDFRLSTDTLNLPGNMPFTEALSQAWEP